MRESNLSSAWTHKPNPGCQSNPRSSGLSETSVSAGNRGRYLTADDPGEVGLLRRKHLQLGFVGSLALILGADLQGQSVVVADVDLLRVAGGTTTRKVSSLRYLFREPSRLRGVSPRHRQPEVGFADVVVSTVQQDVSLREDTVRTGLSFYTTRRLSWLPAW